MDPDRQPTSDPALATAVADLLPDSEEEPDSPRTTTAEGQALATDLLGPVLGPLIALLAILLPLLTVLSDRRSLPPSASTLPLTAPAALRPGSEPPTAMAGVGSGGARTVATRRQSP